MRYKKHKKHKKHNLQEYAGSNGYKFVVSFGKSTPTEGDVGARLLNVQSFYKAVKRNNYKWVLYIEAGDPYAMAKRLSSFKAVTSVTYIGKDTDCKKKFQFIKKLKQHMKIHNFHPLDVQAMLHIVTNHYAASCPAHRPSSSSHASSSHASSHASSHPSSAGGSSGAGSSGAGSSSAAQDGSHTASLRKFLD